jgi:hypothetical protein
MSILRFENEQFASFYMEVAGNPDMRHDNECYWALRKDDMHLNLDSLRFHHMLLSFHRLLLCLRSTASSP